MKSVKEIFNEPKEQDKERKIYIKKRNKLHLPYT